MQSRLSKELKSQTARIFHQNQYHARMEIEIELTGGLGNQLFGYYAGIYFSEKYNGSLTLNFSNLNRPQHRLSDLRSFNLVPHQSKLNKNHNSKFGVLKRRLRDKCILEIPKSSKFFFPNTELINDTHLFGEFPKADRSRMLLRGYFGNFQYYESLPECVTQLSLREPSSNFTQLEELAKNVRPIMLHVRRGDYVTHQEVYGLLSKAYYRKALSMASQLGLDSEIWVFSDDAKAAKEILRGTDGGFRYIEEEFAVTPPESLLIQSLGSVNISANSTFSAWASALNKHAHLKICPKQYFKDGRETPNWPPRNMIAIDSTWE